MTELLIVHVNITPAAPSKECHLSGEAQRSLRPTIYFMLLKYIYTPKPAF